MITILQAAAPRALIGVVAHDKIGRMFRPPTEEFNRAVAGAVMEFEQIAIGWANADAQQKVLDELRREARKP